MRRLLCCTSILLGLVTGCDRSEVFADPCVGKTFQAHTLTSAQAFNDTLKAVLTDAAKAFTPSAGPKTTTRRPPGDDGLDRPIDGVASNDNESNDSPNIVAMVQGTTGGVQKTVSPTIRTGESSQQESAVRQAAANRRMGTIFQPKRPGVNAPITQRRAFADSLHYLPPD